MSQATSRFLTCASAAGNVVVPPAVWGDLASGEVVGVSVGEHDIDAHYIGDFPAFSQERTLVPKTAELEEEQG